MEKFILPLVGIKNHVMMISTLEICPHVINFGFGDSQKIALKL